MPGLLECWSCAGSITKHHTPQGSSRAGPGSEEKRQELGSSSATSGPQPNKHMERPRLHSLLLLSGHLRSPKPRDLDSSSLRDRASAKHGKGS